MPPEIDVKEQPRLSFAKLLDLTLTGIKYRLFRSFMTVVVIAVAVAFMMNTVVERLVSARVGAVVEQTEADLLQVDVLVARVGQPPSLQQTLADLADPDLREARRAELQAFSGLGDDAFSRLRAEARQLNRLLRFLQDLDYGLRRNLVAAVVTPAALMPLAEPENRRDFFATLDADRSVRLPLDRAVVEDLLNRLPGILDRVGAVREVQAAAVQGLREHLQGQPVLGMMADPDADWTGLLASFGFRIPSTAEATLADQARRNQLIREVEQAIQVSDLRQAMARRFNLEPVDINPATLWNTLGNEASATWFIQAARDILPTSPDRTVEGLVSAAAVRQDLFRINALRDDLVEVGEGLLGLNARTAFLLLVSVMVCVVGITNAMLMSVTERYREIATLKCLGALDGSILWIFVFEAALLGLVGALAGAFIGGVIGVSTSLFSFGGYVFQADLLPGLLTAAVAAIVGGTLLAGVASIYPSLKAARLAPMEAMRIE